MEKPGNYEFIQPATSDKYFECDLMRGSVAGGNEQIVTFTFNPPKTDKLLESIGALKGIGQWVENTWELKLTGGFVNPGEIDLK